jgi:lysozyme
VSYRDIAREQLKFDEGVVAHAYQDSEGYWTIGCGRLIDKRLGGGLSPYEINVLLENDLVRAETASKVFFPKFDTLTDNRKAVLLNMAHNLGQARLQGFKRFKEALEAGAYAQAAEEMLASKWAAQTGKRAERLAQKMLVG